MALISHQERLGLDRFEVNATIHSIDRVFEARRQYALYPLQELDYFCAVSAEAQNLADPFAHVGIGAITMRSVFDDEDWHRW